MFCLKRFQLVGPAMDAMSRESYCIAQFPFESLVLEVRVS